MIRDDDDDEYDDNNNNNKQSVEPTTQTTTIDCGPVVQLGFCEPVLMVMVDADDDDDDDNDEEEEDDDDEEEEQQQPYTRSTLLSHRSPDWEHWDGGHVGGVPSWLDPMDLPITSTQLTCPYCTTTTTTTTDDDDEKKKKTMMTMGGSRHHGALTFVCQLYAPGDDDYSFHRTLYVWACSSCCSNSSSSSNGGGGVTQQQQQQKRRRKVPFVQVLQCQLPKVNPYYPNDDGTLSKRAWNRRRRRLLLQEQQQQQSPTTTITINHHLYHNNYTHTCVACGRRSKGKCPTQQLHFCGPIHQKAYRKALKQWNKEQQQQHNAATNKSSLPALVLPGVWKEWELVVEEEPEEEKETTTTTTNAKEVQKNKSSTLFGTTHKSDNDDDNNNDDDDDDDDDANLEQEDLNAMLTGRYNNKKYGGGSSSSSTNSTTTTTTNHKAGTTTTTDPTTLEFHVRMGRPGQVQNQVLRYYGRQRQQQSNNASNDDDDDDDDIPLWIRSDYQPSTNSKSHQKSDIPPCPDCGKERKLECQILPQMLSYLLQDRKQRRPNNNNASSSKQQQQQQQQAALAAASNIIQHADPSQVPPALVDQHNATLERIRNAYLSSPSSDDGSTKSSSSSLSSEELDWGTIAIYTCACKIQPTTDEDDGSTCSRYRSEFAWVQPPLHID